MGYSPPPTTSPLICPAPPFAESTLIALQSTVETLICCRFFVSHLLRDKTVPESRMNAAASKRASLKCRGLESSLQNTLRNIIIAASSPQEGVKAPAFSGSSLTEYKLLIDFAVGPTNLAMTVRDSGELRLLERWSLKLTIDSHMVSVGRYVSAL